MRRKRSKDRKYNNKIYLSLKQRRKLQYRIQYLTYKGEKQLFKRCKTPQFEMNLFFESILSLLIILVKASNVKLTMTMINNDKRYS